MKIELKGKIQIDYSGKYEKIYLKSKEGFMADLIARVGEIKMSFEDTKIQINYWISNDYCTKTEMIEGYLGMVFGRDIESEYEDNGFMGSEWTGYCDSYDTSLTFGGHNFLNELRNSKDKFIIIEFNIDNN